MINGGRNRANDEGYDIPPDEERIPLYTEENNGQPLVPIQVITGAHETADGGMEIEYEQAYVRRPPYGYYFEPQDETPPERNPSRNTEIYYSEKKRLETFVNHWLEEYYVNPVDLARDGFIFVGPGDKVKCVFCLNTLRGWDREDTVEGEHRRHYPECPFVRGKVNHLNIPIPGTRPQMMGLKMKDEKKDMSNVLNRLDTYKNAPPHIISKKNKFADAGLFYTGHKDSLQCYSCGKRFSSWEPSDDPYTEHTKLNPSCLYIQKISQTYNQETPMEEAAAPNNLSTMHEEETSNRSFDYFTAGLNIVKSQELAQSSKAFAQSTDMKQLSDPQPQMSYLKSLANLEMSRQQKYVPSSTASSERNTPSSSLESQIKKDLNSPQLQAFREINDNLGLEEIRQLLKKIRISKGPEYQFSAEDLDNCLHESEKKT